MIQKQAYVLKLKNDIKVSKYENDFVSISKKTGEPVYNSLIEIANERAWEVAQVDYQDKINVTRSISKEGYMSSDYYDEEDKIVNNFLTNYFYSTNIFEDKMRMYCEFMDKYRINKFILNSIIHKVDPKFKTYYDLYGTLGCKAVRYEESSLKNKISDNLKFPDLKNSLISHFKIKSKYTLKDIKFILNDIYKDLGITKTPKASELENYFDLKLILVQDSLSGKRSKGYLILGIK